MIVREAGVLLAIGLGIGALLSIYAARTAATFLYELKPGDPLTLTVAIAGLAAVTLLASWIPARRASRLQRRGAARGMVLLTQRRDDQVAHEKRSSPTPRSVTTSSARVRERPPQAREVLDLISSHPENTASSFGAAP